MYLNEATLLNNVRVRYSKDKIYVSPAECFLSSVKGRLDTEMSESKLLPRFAQNKDGRLLNNPTVVRRTADDVLAASTITMAHTHTKHTLRHTLNTG